MARVIANSLLSLLLSAVFLWGGCVSCPRFFMFPGENDGECCGKNGECKRGKPTEPSEPKRECKRMAFEPQSAPDLHIVLTHAGHPPNPMSCLLAPTIFPPIPALEVKDHSPPDVQSLYATFLI